MCKDWLTTGFPLPIIQTHPFPPSESCPVYLIHALRAHLFFSKWLFTLPSGQAHAWAHGVGTQDLGLARDEIFCLLLHSACASESIYQSLLPPPSTEAHRPQDGVLYLDLCCSQHAETCYLHRVRVCVLVEIPWLPRFRSHFGNDWTSGWRLMDFEPVLPCYPFSFCCV